MLKVPHSRNQKFHYSPLRYPGGKTFLFPLFDHVIKKTGLQNTTYVEPFAGGAGAALALLFLEKVERIVINDLDRAIYAFWKSAIFHSENFLENIYSVPVTVKEWKKQRSVYNDPRAGLFERGFATFFLNRTNISGILDGGPIGGLDQRGTWKIGARFNKVKLADRISLLSQYKNRISVFNKDGVELINDYLSKTDTFIYLDPPYYEKGATLYLNHFEKGDHSALANRLNQKADSFWLLTYDNKKEIKSLYPDSRMINFTLNYNARDSRRGEEVLILSNAITV